MIVNSIATVLTVTVFGVAFLPFATAGYFALTRNGRARHHWAVFVASRTTVNPSATTPPVPKEFPMRKIVLFCLITAALLVGLALTGCSASQPAASAAAPAAPAAASVCADVIRTGEANHAAQAAQRQAQADSMASVHALIADSNYGTPAHDALQKTTDDANARFALANADVTTTDADYQAAKTALPDAAARSACRPLTDLDLQFLNAHAALNQATDATRTAAQAKLDAVQAKWAAAKTS
jgi:hypothetical protein